MNSHPNQIQALIDEIEGVLQQPAPRLPWMGETTRESRALLDRVRSYLLEQQQTLATQPRTPEPHPNPEKMPAGESATELLQSVMQEMKGLHSSVVQPLRDDIDALQRRRDELLQEIRHLDTQRQTKTSLAQQSAQQQQIIAEFLQTLMGRLHESINQQIGQTLHQIENEFFNDDPTTQYQTAFLEGSATGNDSPEYIPVWDPSGTQYGQRTGPLHPRERLAQLRMFQHKIDEMMLTLDSTVSVVFETLLQNVQVYEASLSKRLETMHNLGRQSEEMFAGLVSQLAQSLPSPASLESEAQDQENAKPPVSQSGFTETTTPSSQQTSQPTVTPAELKEDWLQLLETEEPSPLSSPTPETPMPVSEAKLEKQLNQLYDDLFTLENPVPPATPQTNGLDQSFLEEDTERPQPPSDPTFEESEEFSVEFQPFDEDTASLILDEPTEDFSIPQPVIESTSTDEEFPEFESFDEDTASLILDQPETLETSVPPSADIAAVLDISTPQRPPYKPQQDRSETRTADLSLKDLFSDTAFPVEAPPSSTPATPATPPDPEESIISENWVVEGFIPASPDEDLLPVSEFEEEEPEPSFAINPITLTQLKQDLFSLEETEEDTPQPENDFFGTSPTPMQVSAELLPHQNWDNNSLEEWATELDRALSQSQTENSAYNTPISEQEEELLASVDDWFTQLSDETPEIAKESSFSPMTTTDPSRLTLDEAFASMEAATMPPESNAPPASSEDLDLFETPEWMNSPEEAEPVLVQESQSSSALDDLFAGLTSSQDPELDQDELFDFSDWQKLNEIEEQTDEVNEFETSRLDELFATLEEPPTATREADPDIFSTMASRNFLDDHPFPADADSEKSLIEGEKKNEESLDWESELGFAGELDLETEQAQQLYPSTSQMPEMPANDESLDWESELGFAGDLDLETEESTSQMPERPANEESLDWESELGFACDLDLETEESTSQMPERPANEESLDWESKLGFAGELDLETEQAQQLHPSTSQMPERPADDALLSDLFIEDWDTKKDWYLGIDFGTTGLSATLLNYKTHELYPIYWQDIHAKQPGERCFRLPVSVILTHKNLSPSQPFDLSNTQLSLTLDPDRPSLDANQVLFTHFKPYLKVGITGTGNGRTPTSPVWEPVIQWSDPHQISLSLIQQALQLLISTLNPAQTSTPLQCQAVDLDPQTFTNACEQLAGVIVSVPANWPDSYSFNLREAILGAGLVKQPEQIIVIHEAIAAVLSGLRGAAGEKILKPRTLSEKLNFNSGADWLGGTVVISSGANLTELALVNLPSNLQNLTYNDFYLHTLAYAGNAIDQDIICQLLLRNEKDYRKLEALDPSLVQLSAFEALPKPGEPMLEKRYRMQQLLESSAAGQLLLAAAGQLKLILQHQEEFTLKLSKQRWVCVRKELEQRVFVPYVQHLNRELNLLLAESGIQPVAIQQVICTGGTASLPAMNRWLRQKFSNATIIQDTYPPDRLPACSRIAYGLATVPLHPQVFDVQRQQYNDYFLLRELLSVFPNHPCTFAEVLQLLERQGINTRACQSRLLTFLENRLPAGIHLDPSDRILLSESSCQDPEYLSLQTTPLFYSQENQTYRPNPQQFQRVRRYLNQLMIRTHQQIEEPFTINLGQRLS